MDQRTAMQLTKSLDNLRFTANTISADFNENRTKTGNHAKLTNMMPYAVAGMNYLLETHKPLNKLTY